MRVSPASSSQVVHGFEVFSEQQLLVLNDPTRVIRAEFLQDLYRPVLNSLTIEARQVIDFNNSEYGSTHVDDYWVTT